jgi:thiosulfate dehydrogenase (quinone) large subunit
MSGLGAGRRSPAHDQRVQTHGHPRVDTRRPEVMPNRAWLGPPPSVLFSAGWVLLPLRIFLGFTFCFAGLEKLANPRFFDAADPASIQAQLSGAARLSPVHALVAPLVHVAIPLGLFIALAEVFIGIGTVFGLWTRAAAGGGMVLSLMLFLTVSFHSSPYYTGSDIVFAFAWTPLLLAGSGGALSVDALVAHNVRRKVGLAPVIMVPIRFATVHDLCGLYSNGTCGARRGAPCEPAPCPVLIGRSMSRTTSTEAVMDRRTFAAKSTVSVAAAVVTLAGGGLAAGIGRLVGGSSSKPATPALGGLRDGGISNTSPPTSATSSTSAATEPSSTPPTTALPPPRPPGVALGPVSQIPVGGAGSFKDPGTGDPSLVIRPEAGTLVAFDAVCPHAGCIVQYDAADQIIVCPCHGSEFNANTGEVERGPAVSGLQKIEIAEGADGQLYAV